MLCLVKKTLKASGIFHQQVSESVLKEWNCFFPVPQVNEACAFKEVFKRLASRSETGHPGFMGVVLHPVSYICDYSSEVFLCPLRINWQLFLLAGGTDLEHVHGLLCCSSIYVCSKSLCTMKYKIWQVVSEIENEFLAITFTSHLLCWGNSCNLLWNICGSLSEYYPLPPSGRCFLKA